MLTDRHPVTLYCATSWHRNAPAQERVQERTHLSHSTNALYEPRLRYEELCFFYTLIKHSSTCRHRNKIHSAYHTQFIECTCALDQLINSCNLVHVIYSWVSVCQIKSSQCVWFLTAWVKSSTCNVSNKQLLATVSNKFKIKSSWRTCRCYN